MKQLIYLLFCLTTYPLSIEAQNRIALQHNGLSSFFTSLETAYNAAADGDTIHLPGGAFAFPNNTMSKRLAVIGTGIFLDSSKVNGVSVIGQLKITSSASESYITGVFFGGVTIDSTVQNVSVAGLSFVRCYLPSFSFLNGTEGNRATNFLMTENYLGSLENSSITNFLVSNNIVNGVIWLNNSEINNNIVTSIFARSVKGENSIIKNNVFKSPVQVVVNGNDFAVGFYFNNYNCNVNGVFQPYSQGSGNYSNPTISFESLFVNFSQGNYRLTQTAAQAYIGTDGTQIGIYGGRFPWKDGSMPFNPHISTFNVDPQTDNTGRLRLRATINAQRN